MVELRVANVCGVGCHGVRLHLQRRTAWYIEAVGQVEVKGTWVTCRVCPVWSAGIRVGGH